MTHSRPEILTHYEMLTRNIKRGEEFFHVWGEKNRAKVKIDGPSWFSPMLGKTGGESKKFMRSMETRFPVTAKSNVPKARFDTLLWEPPKSIVGLSTRNTWSNTLSRIM